MLHHIHTTIMKIFPYRLVHKNKLAEAAETFKALQNEVAVATVFANEIKSGKMGSSLPIESFSESGAFLGASLIEMRDRFKSISNEAQQRDWINGGLTRFVEILRSHNHSLAELSDEIITHLVKYINANQGALFILNDEQKDDTFLELTACYAYDRKRHMSKRCEIGQGLIGQTFLEKQTVYMKTIPADYIKITSGLGEALPRNLLVVPLKIEDRVLGIVEIAGFHPFKDFEIEFVEKLGENIASSISSVKTNENTQKLLRDTQMQAEQMRAQEEEMRQNMEELSATQEDMARNIDEIEKLKKESEVRESVFELTTIMSESDIYGTITMVNNKLCEVSKYAGEELVGQPHKIFRHPDMPKELFKLFWNTIKKGENFQAIIKNKTKDGGHYWVDATIVPVKDDTGKTTKYIGARYHITNDELAEKLYNEQAKQLNLPLLSGGR